MKCSINESNLQQDYPEVQTLDRTQQTRFEKEDKAREEIGKKSCLGMVSLSFKSTNKPEYNLCLRVPSGKSTERSISPSQSAMA